MRGPVPRFSLMKGLVFFADRLENRKRRCVPQRRVVFSIFLWSAVKGSRSFVRNGRARRARSRPDGILSEHVLQDAGDADQSGHSVGCLSFPGFRCAAGERCFSVAGHSLHLLFCCIRARSCCDTGILQQHAHTGPCSFCDFFDRHEKALRGAAPEGEKDRTEGDA